MRGRSTGWWVAAAVGAVLVGSVAAGLYLAIRDAQEGDEAVARPTCEDAVLLPAAGVNPGEPYRIKALTQAELDSVEARVPLEGAARMDAVRIVDTRDRAEFLVTTLTSTSEPVREEDAFAGLTDNAEGTIEVEMGARPARLARLNGRVAIVATDGSCSVVALHGVEEAPTRALAAELQVEER